MITNLWKQKTPIVAFVIIALSFVAFLPAANIAAEAYSAPHSSNVTVVFNAQTLPANAEAIVQAAGGEVVHSIPEIGVVSARATSVSTEAFIDNLRGNAAVNRAGRDLIAELIQPTQLLDDDGNSVAPDTPPPNHPIPPPPAVILGAPAPDRYYKPLAGNVPPNQWAIYRVGGFGGGIYGSTGGAWDVTTGSPSVTVAIVDTGISYLHPDVKDKVIDNQAAIFGTAANLPYDDGTPDDQQGHGTWTSSLAAGALSPGVYDAAGLGGVVGVAPGVKLANLKVLVRTSTGGGSGEFSWTTAAIVYAANQGYQVVSMSLGGFADLTDKGDQAVYVALTRATDYAFNHGSLLVAAAGNSGLNLDALPPLFYGGNFVELPGSLPNVVAVMATTNPIFTGSDDLASYSDYGSSLHGISAPGGDPPAGGAIGTTGFVRGACSPGRQGPTQSVYSGCFTLGHVYYVRATGTSASTPLVAGAAALVYSVRPNLRPNNVRAILYSTAQDIGPVGYDLFFNFGLVDAHAAVLRAQTWAMGGSSARSS